MKIIVLYFSIFLVLVLFSVVNLACGDPDDPDEGPPLEPKPAGVSDGYDPEQCAHWLEYLANTDTNDDFEHDCRLVINYWLLHCIGDFPCQCIAFFNYDEGECAHHFNDLINFCGCEPAMVLEHATASGDDDVVDGFIGLLSFNFGGLI